MLNKNELFSRFVRIIPGSSVACIDLPAFDADIYFELLSISGLEEMHRYSKDARLYDFFEFDPFDTIDKTAKYIEKLELRMAGDPLTKTAMYWFIRRKRDGYLIGSAGLTSLNFERQSVEWGYGIDPELWGEGYILQIMEILKQFVFHILELNRLYGTTMITNHRTIASLLTSGMKQEGVLRQFYCKNGIFVDGWHYAMLQEEYHKSERNLVTSIKLLTVEDSINIIQSVLTEEVINLNSTMHNVSSWDSLNHMSIMIAVTEQTGISLSPSEMMRANSVQTLTRILADRAKGK
jgi:ribosomal-protein-alanine N-acetyltransferase